MDKDGYVWYVSYGSNMLKERFMHYIKGGQFEGGGACHEPCRDISDPVAETAFDIPYDMYFGKSSFAWEGKGVSFLDISRPGHALGVAYLITREQFEHVVRQENGGSIPSHGSWYNIRLSLGTLDGCEALTFTNDTAGGYNGPGERYLDTLRRGLAEHYRDMSREEIDSYLESCVR